MMLGSQEILIRLLTAALLGAVVGIERERLDWVAGLRTHMLVCLGAALFMIVSVWAYMDALEHPRIILDPSRVAAGVVSGIGFLGAGTILFRRDVIRGLTTAASLWVVAAVGLAVGSGLYLAGAATTGLMLVILAGLKPLERRLFRNRRLRSVKLVIADDAPLAKIRSALRGQGIHPPEMLLRPAPEGEGQELELALGKVAGDTVLALVERLREIEGVREVRQFQW